MKIEGQKYLNKNNYSKIIMDLLGEKNIVKVKCKKDYPTDTNDVVFMDEIRKLDDDEKTLEIINYFLRNNTISGISQGYVKGYKGKYSIVNSLGQDLLAIKIPNNELGCEIVKNVIKKFYFDRYNYCFNNEIKEIHSNSNGDYFGNNIVVLKSNGGLSLTQNNKDFLRELIEEKLDYVHEAHIECLEYQKTDTYKCYSLYLVCGDLKIYLSSENIVRNVQNIIYNYNYKLYNDKEKQLKLRGAKNVFRNI